MEVGEPGFDRILERRCPLGVLVDDVGGLERVLVDGVRLVLSAILVPDVPPFGTAVEVGLLSACLARTEPQDRGCSDDRVALERSRSRQEGQQVEADSPLWRLRSGLGQGGWVEVAHRHGRVGAPGRPDLSRLTLVSSDATSPDGSPSSSPGVCLYVTVTH